MGIENKLICLVLNSAWQPITHKTVKEAINNLCVCDENGKFKTFAIDVQYEMRDGEYDFSAPSAMNPITWDEWIKLPIRDFDFTISSPRMTIRVPTVIVESRYGKMPIKRPKLTKSNIWKRDNGVCQYTGRKLSKNDGNIDHVIPKCRGGKESWDNLVLCDKHLNEKKGHQIAKEVGLSLIKNPKEPLGLPASFYINEAKHADWSHFLLKKN